MKEHPTIKGYFGTEDGKVFNNKGLKGTFKELKPAKLNTGYYLIQCGSDENNKKIQLPLHRFLAEIFIPNPNNLSDVNHKDCNKSNNIISNLEWMSHKDNCIHGRTQMGKRFLIENVKNGEKYEIRNLVKWCEDIGINRTSAYKVIWGEQKTLKRRTYKVTQIGW